MYFLGTWMSLSVFFLEVLLCTVVSTVSMLQCCSRQARRTAALNPRLLWSVTDLRSTESGIQLLLLNHGKSTVRCRSVPSELRLRLLFLQHTRYRSHRYQHWASDRHDWALVILSLLSVYFCLRFLACDDILGGRFSSWEIHVSTFLTGSWIKKNNVNVISVRQLEKK